MHVRVLGCPNCGTEVQGDFLLSKFERLSEEHLNFLLTFIECRGSLKDICASMGISYPTARNRLDALIAAMGFEGEKTAKAHRIAVLEQVKNGALTTDEALVLLQGEDIVNL
jgi:hypothetical protein